MGHPSARAYVSYADSFEAEDTSEERHEWIDGVVYAMSRSAPERGRLVSAVNSELRELRAAVVRACDHPLRRRRRLVDSGSLVARKGARVGASLMDRFRAGRRAATATA
jgi:hypothetical protein